MTWSTWATCARTSHGGATPPGASSTGAWATRTAAGRAPSRTWRAAPTTCARSRTPTRWIGRGSCSWATRPGDTWRSGSRDEAASRPASHCTREHPWPRAAWCPSRAWWTWHAPRPCTWATASSSPCSEAPPPRCPSATGSARPPRSCPWASNRCCCTAPRTAPCRWSSARPTRRAPPRSGTTRSSCAWRTRTTSSSSIRAPGSGPRSSRPWARSCESAPGVPFEHVHEAVDVQEAVVERRGRGADDVRGAEVAVDALRAQRLQHALGLLAEAQGQVGAAPRGVPRGQAVHEAGWEPVEQELQVARELHALLAQGGHRRPVEELQGRAQRRELEDGRIGQHPALGARRRLVIRLHQEARPLVIAPPTGEAVQRKIIRVALVDEGSGQRARAPVEVLVRAPHREVRPIVVQGQPQVARGVRQVEAHAAALGMRGAGDGRHVERLAIKVVHVA